MLRIDDAILLNQLAQGIVSMQNGYEWFEGKELDEKRAVLLGLNFMIQQAAPHDCDVKTALAEAGLKPTLTPCLLLVRPNLKVQLAKLAQLPGNELRNVFLLLVKLLGVSDQRRREQKPLDLVSHWWHRDLSNPLVIKEIQEENGGGG